MNRIARTAVVAAFLGPCFALPWSSAAAQDGSATGQHVSTTIVRGATPVPPGPAVSHDERTGDVRLNFPAVDLRDLAKAVLGDILGKRYAVAPGVAGSVTLVTDHPIPRADILFAFENALRASNFALVRQEGGAFLIAPVGEARGSAPVLGQDEVGYGSETIQLKFIAAAQIKAILDPIVPGAVTIADPARNVITVTGATGQRRSVHDLVAQFDVDWLRGMSFGLFVPSHTDSRILAPEIDKLLNGPGSPSSGLVRLIVMDKINGILAISVQPQYLDDVKRWLEVLDREGESSEPRLFVYRVQNGRSSDLANTLNNALGNLTGHSATGSDATSRPAVDTFDVQPSPQHLPGRPPTTIQPATGGARGGDASSAPGINITSDETNNAVLVFGTPRQYAVVEEALRQLDITPLQVLIDAVITEVDLTHNLQFGVQFSGSDGRNTWSIAPNPPPSSSSSSGTTPAVTPTIQPGFTWALRYGSIQGSLNALSALTHVNVLSAPQMMVLNNHTASLDVGDQVPIVTASSTSTIGTNAPTVNSVDYRDTGVILKVTPRVNAGGLVLLDIDQEVSDVAQTSSSTINSPTIQQRKFSTSIAVQDGQTIALGGLIRDNVTHGRSGVPFLNAIPILGWLAGQQLKTEARTELIILMTPRVVRTGSDADAVTEELRRKIQAIPPLKPIDAFRP
ncbi:MAG TPA: type II secretion system secretin GspD [Caulobacteraceae bacterium]|jgi:general secretion pathway protein D|nr:type II secretion system secretin GspD [Caulobacteraceae bacterium]